MNPIDEINCHLFNVKAFKEVHCVYGAESLPTICAANYSRGPEIEVWSAETWCTVPACENMRCG